MAAPKFNEYWKLRKKAGVDKLFNDPDEIIELAQAYIEHCKQNPIIIQDFIKSGEKAGKIIDIERPRIPTQLGFTVFLGITEATLSNYKNNENYKAFFKSFAYVCENFRSLLAEEAITGQANAMIAARILGLKERQDITSNDNELKTVELSKSEAKQISDELENDI